MKKTVFTALAMLALLNSCNKEISSPDINEDYKGSQVIATVPAVISEDNVQTKAFAIGEADNKATISFKWETEIDAISVFAEKKGEVMSYSVKSVDSENPKVCFFNVENFKLIEGATYYGFYPSNTSLDPKAIAVDYTGQRQLAFDDDTHVSAYSLLVTPAAVANEFGGASLNFAHKTTWVVFRILASKNFTAEKITLSTSAADAFTTKGTMDVTSSTFSATKKSNKLVLYLGEPEEGLEIKAGVYYNAYLAMAPATMPDFTVTVSGYDSEENPVSITRVVEKSYTFNAGTIRRVAVEDEDAVLAIAQIGETVYPTLEDAINAALAANDGTPVELLCDITYAEGAAWTPIVFNGGTVVIDGKGFTVTGLPGMLFNKKGSGGHHLRMSNITFDGAKVNGTTGNEAIICGYADSMNELYFENVTIKNSTVTGSNYAGAFIGYAAGYDVTNNGPVYQHVTFKDCVVENSTITGGGSTGALIGHAAGNTNAVIVVDGSTVKNNVITSTGSTTNKAGSLFGTVGNAGANSTAEAPKGLFVTATVSGNTVKSGSATITTICGRQGSTGGRLIMTEGGSYDARPYNEADTWAKCADGYTLSETDGIWTVVEAVGVARIGSTYYPTLADAIAAAQSGETVTLLADIEENVTIEAGQNVTVDLNSFNVTAASAKAAFTNFGTLKIQGEGNVTRADNMGYVIDNRGTIELAGGNYKKTAGTSLNALLRNAGTMTISGGTYYAKYKNDGSNDNIYSPNTVNIEHADVVTVSMTGGEFLTTTNGFTNTTTTLCVVTGGTFASAPHNYLADGYGVEKNAAGKYVVSDGFILTDGTNYYKTVESAFTTATKALSLIVNYEGNIEVPAAATINYLYLNKHRVSGNVINNAEKVLVLGESSTAKATSENGIVTGTISGNVLVTSGKYVNDPAAYVNKYEYKTQQTGGYYVVVDKTAQEKASALAADGIVAITGSGSSLAYFTSVQAAWNASTSTTSCNITLVADVIEDIVRVKKSAPILKMEGHNFTGKMDTRAEGANKYFNINGAGTATLNEVYCGNMTIDSKANVVIKGGIVTGTITVKSGCTLSITGGTFSKDPSNYVANGYEAKDNGDGTWTVVKAGSSNGSTVGLGDWK